LPYIRGLNDAGPIRVEDALLENIEVGERVLVIGGRRNGCETAEFLSNMGKSVTIVHAYNRPAPDVLPVFRTPLLSRLKQNHVTLHRGLKKGRIEQKRFIGQRADKAETIIDFDTVIVTGRRKPRKTEWEILEDTVDDLFFIGDAAGARGIMEAVAEGNRAGRVV
jgi:pyruvate/2-oxoglutarate dehydrogenase complex dihydrolipoamide dehydrogenase (E3) component